MWRVLLRPGVAFFVMTSVNVYLNFTDECEAAFDFYKSVFGGEFSSKQRFKDVPAEANRFPAEEAEKIMHVSLPVGPHTVLMGSDSPGMMPVPVKGSNFSVSVMPDSAVEAERIFGALSEGGTITMPLEKAFWGALFGMCTDRFGVRWMVNFELKE